MSKRDFDLYFIQLEEAGKRLGFRVSQSVVDQFIQINVVEELCSVE